MVIWMAETLRERLRERFGVLGNEEKLSIKERFGRKIVGPRFDPNRRIVEQMKERWREGRPVEPEPEVATVPYENLFSPEALEELTEAGLTPSRWEKFSEWERAQLIEGGGVGYEYVLESLKRMDEVPDAISDSKFEMGRVAIE